MIERLEIQPYRLPLRRTWQSARGLMHEREGWLLCAHAQGLRGYGDYAPMPEAGTESREAGLMALEGWRARVVGQPLARLLEEIEADRSPAPAARFALECALLDLTAQEAGVPLRQWLDPQAADSVAVNATLGPLGDVMPEMIKSSCRSGFRILKIKVGLTDPDIELGRLTALARHLPPEAALRLDANGAWSYAQAVPLLAALNTLPIESLEEPLREPSRDQLQPLQAIARFPLALDESLHRGATTIELEGLGVRRIVLKPAAVGGLRRTLDLANRAVELGIEVVLTSLIESAAGLWPSLQLAAALNSPLAQGLATSPWLARDLGRAPEAEQGHIRLGPEAGGGFNPRPAEPGS
ncbi:MAG: o-succinylbenzoate synthase [Chromatiaceae bacterium]|nr:o-succinylbenzoate synthase [Chromatiaceae bacterium]